jgi:hypothetical protein
MLPRSPEVETDANPLLLRDKALNLRESVNSSRARMSAQREHLERLRAEIAQLRALVEKPLPVPAPSVAVTAAKIPAPIRSAPLMKEIAAVSAASAVSFKTGGSAWKHAPYAFIFLAAIALQVHQTSGGIPAPRAAAPIAIAEALPASPSSPEVVAEDDGASEALLLAHDWHLPGDERPLAERLGSSSNPPGTLPEWLAERTGDHMYRVSFRPGRADIGYDFDVDLAAHRVDPTPETAELISPRLASRR